MGRMKKEGGRVGTGSEGGWEMKVKRLRSYSNFQDPGCAPYVAVHAVAYLGFQ